MKTSVRKVHRLLGAILACATTVAAPAAMNAKISADEVRQLIRPWKAMPREAAQKLISKYGPPDEATPLRLIWHQNGPWMQTELVNEEIPHDFPMPHQDMLKQSVAYTVPEGRVNNLFQYDGSVIVERTKGTIAARCDREELNFLAINLAHDVATGKKSVGEARESYAETAMAFKQGQKPPYTQGLTFNPPRTAGDPDEPARM